MLVMMLNAIQHPNNIISRYLILLKTIISKKTRLSSEISHIQIDLSGSSFAENWTSKSREVGLILPAVMQAQFGDTERSSHTCMHLST